MRFLSIVVYLAAKDNRQATCSVQVWTWAHVWCVCVVAGDSFFNYQLHWQGNKSSASEQFATTHSWRVVSETAFFTQANWRGGTKTWCVAGGEEFVQIASKEGMEAEKATVLKPFILIGCQDKQQRWKEGPVIY